MNTFLLNILKKIYIKIYYLFTKTLFTREFLEIVLEKSWQEIFLVRHNGIELQFTTPNALNKFRAETFSTKEPETLEWIDSITSTQILWDIGANVGLYSCYAAKSRGCKVFAFEPSIFNLELLARNVHLNKLSNSIIIIPIPLCEGLSFNKFNMSFIGWGGALSTFGKEYGHDGKKLNKVFEYQLLGLSMDEAIDRLFIPQPDFIKMDVDGLEQLILAGGNKTLKKVKSISIEVNEDFQEQSLNCEILLKEAGLKFKGKKHSEMFNGGQYKNTFNQVWER
ncbi:MAG: FkbM family methyltransferase [Leptospiraceae bacterium]|nr:FkbM family methyltransferase [Leptospiraceae bacterium]